MKHCYEDEAIHERRREDINSFDCDRGIIRLYGDISPKTVKEVNEFASDFNTHPLGVGVLSPEGIIKKKAIWVEVMSSGGCVQSALAIYDILTTAFPSFVDIYTSAVGYISSSANLIYCAGTKRLALPSTQFLLDKPVALMIDGTTNDFELQADYVQRIQSHMTRVYSTVFKGAKGKKILTQLSNENQVLLSVEEALAVGLVTDIMGLE